MKRIISVLTLTALVSTMLMLVGCGKKEQNKQVDVNPQTSEMKAICELATMDCYYHNVAKYTQEDASGFWLWKKDKRFWVEYSGIVKIGIDASKLEMKVEGEKVTISIPEAVVLSSKVDPDSLSKDSFFIDKHSATVEAKDQTEAYKEAEEYMTKKASSDTTLLANAGQRAKDLIENYVKNIGAAVGKEYQISWVYLKNDNNSNNSQENS